MGKLFFHMLVWTKMGTKWSVFCPALVVICNVWRASVKKERTHQSLQRKHTQAAVETEHERQETCIHISRIYLQGTTACVVDLSHVYLLERKQSFPCCQEGRKEHQKRNCVNIFFPEDSLSQRKILFQILYNSFSFVSQQMKLEVGHIWDILLNTEIYMYFMH